MINNTNSDWGEFVGSLRCPKCAQFSLADATATGLQCKTCGGGVPVIDQVVLLKEQFDGNNGIAAEFYNSQRWDKYRFWKWFTPFNDRAVQRWSEEVLVHVPELNGTKLLDIAIGDGRNMPFLPSDCEVVGVDISIAQLKSCRERYRDRKLCLVQAEAESLPFPDNSFDHVMSFGAFNYFNDPLRSLQEMARVVKPNGKIVVTDEYADLPDRMLGQRIGLPGLDRWIMSRFLHLGSELTEMIEEHRELRIEPIVEQVLTDWEMFEVCQGWAYCFVGTPGVIKSEAVA